MGLGAVGLSTEPSGVAEAQWVPSRVGWIQGPRRLVLSAAFLVYLLFVGLTIPQYSHGAGELAGFAVLGAFCATYMLFAAHGVLLARARERHWSPIGSPIGEARYWALTAALLALFIAELPFARRAAFVMCVYVTVLVVGRLGTRSWPVVLALALAALLVPTAFPSWHATVVSDLDTVTPVAIPIVALATLGLMELARANAELARARADVARLSAETERSRIARDLHDLLGHSLTTITVKAGLAHRLGDTEPARAFSEIAEVEALARRSLQDVRAAVSNYREVTLAGELATGRELLRAAGIAADLPSAVDMVRPGCQELFGWVVREGLTNVVRHAHAGSCAIRVTAASVEVLDDGVGGAVTPGNGLAGLRERAAALGGVIEAGPLEPTGWRLRVSLDAGRPA